MFKALLLIYFVLGNYTYAKDVHIFFNDKLKLSNKTVIQNYNLKFHNLDDTKRVMSILNNSLPTSQMQAQVIVRERLNKYKKMLESAFFSNALAHHYKIEKLPAVIFDNGLYVYYGSNLKKALLAYEGKLK